MASLPALPSALDSVARIAEDNAARSVWNLVLDDDPTGTQTVRDVPVLLPRWSNRNLEDAARPGTTFVLTNSRSLPEARAAQITYDLVTNARRIALREGLRLRVISRSDSTLRGHFAAEIEATRMAYSHAGDRLDGTLFVPAYLEAGRTTAGDVQWLSLPGGNVPVVETEYARDLTFGYDELDLADWVRARVRPRAIPVSTISLEQLRGPAGVAQVSRVLASTPDGIVVGNAVAPLDLEVLMLGLLERERAGANILVRCAPSFVRLCAGQPVARALEANDIGASGAARTGLIVVGSHTALTNAQVEELRAEWAPHVIELDAAQVATGDGDVIAAAVATARDAVLAALATRHVILRTTRALVTEGYGSPLATSRAISDALMAVVKGVAVGTDLEFLVAKGGITSSDVASKALGARRALVVGQLLDGQIPLWRLADGIRPGMNYVVFPGNVGSDDALARVVGRMTRMAASGPS